MGSVCSIENSFSSDLSAMVKNRRERLEEWLNQKTNYDISSESTEETTDTEEETDSDKTPFERLVKDIKSSDLTLAEKKQQIHYAKYALLQMDEEQSGTFEKNMKTLIRLKELNQSGQYDAVLNASDSDYSDEIEKIVEKLKKLKEKISEQNESLEDTTDSDSSTKDEIKVLLKSSTVEVSETIKISYSSYSSKAIDQYVENVNLKYESIISSTATVTSSSLNIVA